MQEIAPTEQVQDQQVEDQAEADMMDVDPEFQDNDGQAPDQNPETVEPGPAQPAPGTPAVQGDENSLVLGPVQPDSDVVPRVRGRKRKRPVVEVPAAVRPAMEGPKTISTEVMERNLKTYVELMTNPIVRGQKKADNCFAQPMRSFRGTTLNPNLLNIAGISLCSICPALD